MSQEKKTSTEPQTNDQSHKPAKHIEDTARLASSVEEDKNPSKIQRTED